MSGDVRVTAHGITFGPAEVVCLMSDERFGVTLLVQGKREAIEVRVTPGGRIRHAACDPLTFTTESAQ